MRSDRGLAPRVLGLGGLCYLETRRDQPSYIMLIRQFYGWQSPEAILAKLDRLPVPSVSVSALAHAICASTAEIRRSLSFGGCGSSIK